MLDQIDREKIDNIIADRKSAHTFYSDHSPVYRSFVDLEQKTYTSRALDKKSKELIALGISISINCESCIEWYIKQALDAGTSREEIIETIEVGIEMGGGPATVSSRFALKVLEYYYDHYK